MAATQLFTGIPAAAANVPGGVTPQITADIRQTPMSIQDQATAYALQQRMKEDRKREWAEAAAANSVRKDRFAGTGLNAQGWQTYSPEDIKLRSAFNEVYGPQISQALQYQRINADTPEGKKLRQQRDFWTIRPGGEKEWERFKPKVGSDAVSAMLDQMWRRETDPYLNAVGGGMSAQATLKAMYPSVGGSNPKAWRGGGSSSSGSSSSG